MSISGITVQGWKMGIDAGAKKKEDVADTGNFAALLASLSQVKSTSVQEAVKAAPASSSKPSANDEFMAYMQKSPAERMQEAWLKQHGMTKEEFDALPAKEKEAIIQQMRADIEEKIKQETQAKLDRSSQVLV